MKPIFLLAVTVILTWSCDRNRPPVISGITCSPETFSAGTLFSLTVTASDEDNDLLIYQWTASGGQFVDSTNLPGVFWKSPVDGKGQTFLLTVTVSDQHSETSRDYPITLTEPIFGMISGFVYFAGCKVPVGMADVIVDERVTRTDTTGFYHLDSIPVGKHTLKIRKSGFSAVDRSVNVLQFVDLKENISLNTVTFASKVYGIVKTADSLPVAGAIIILLNPDRTESDISASSDSRGYYMLRYVPLGQRQIVVQKKSTDEFGFVNVSLNLMITGPEYPLDIEMEKFPLTGRFTDTRDGHVYGYRIIGSQTWMSENLAWLPEVDPPSDGNSTGRFYYVYGYDGHSVDEAKQAENFAIYGVLYSWNAAMAGCPVGWHLPSDREWDVLEVYLGPDEGFAMKSVSYWNNHGNGNNSSGFDARPSGVRIVSGSFTGLGSGTGFWSSTSTQNYVWYRWLSADDRSVWRGGVNRASGNSVRCLKN